MLQRAKVEPWLRSRVVLGALLLGALLALGSCDASHVESAPEHDGEAADQQTPSCPTVARPDPCADASNPVCIVDLRAARSRFPICRTGYAYLPFVVSCGRYDGVVAAGIDSATTYYFDRSDGHLVGVTNTGLTTLPPCGAFDPSFVPSDCDAPAACPADAGAGE